MSIYFSTVTIILQLSLKDFMIPNAMEARYKDLLAMRIKLYTCSYDLNVCKRRSL